jgi:hypothetical protein
MKGQTIRVSNKDATNRLTQILEDYFRPFVLLRWLFSHRRTNCPKCSNLTLNFFAGHAVFLRHNALATFLADLPPGLPFGESKASSTATMFLFHNKNSQSLPKSQSGFNYGHST